MAAVASGIDETSKRCAIKWLSVGKMIYFLNNLFSQSATLPVYLFVSLFVNPTFFILQFFSPEYFQFKVLV